MNNPFARPKPNPKRDKPRRVRGRVILRGKDKEELRREVFRRSGGFCEEIVRCQLPECNEGGKAWHTYRCGQLISWETMELSHLKHGPRRSDTPEDTIASCKECHARRHNAGGKPVARKPGRLMSRKEAEHNWFGMTCCFCDKPKFSETTFCEPCALKLSAQSRRDIEETQGRDYLQSVAAAETELLGKGAV